MHVLWERAACVNEFGLFHVGVYTLMRAYIRPVQLFFCVFVFLGVYTLTMPGGRDKNKKMLGFWATPEEKIALQKAAKKAGFKDLGEFLRAIAEGAVKVSPQIKALALAAMGAQSGGAGCLVFIFAIPAALWLLC